MSSYSEYYRNASLYAASFDSTRIELQFLNLYGRVDNSTQGVAAGTAPQTPEIARALESGSIEVFSGKDPVTGESVMAVTTPLKFNGSTVALMRYVTATRQIDHQILLDHPHHQRHHRRGHLSGADLQSAVHQQRGGPGGRGDGRRQAHLRRQLRHPDARTSTTDEMGELVDNINDMSLKIKPESRRSRREFISSVSHELRTPLTAINGWGETHAGGRQMPAQTAPGHAHHSQRGPAAHQHGGGAAGVLQACRTAVSPCRIEHGGPAERSLRTPFTPIRSCSAQEGIHLNYDDDERTVHHPIPGRPGAAEAGARATYWTTPPSTAAPASASIASSAAGGGQLCHHASGTTGPASPRRSCPM